VHQRWSWLQEEMEEKEALVSNGRTLFVGHGAAGGGLVVLAPARGEADAARTGAGAGGAARDNRKAAAARLLRLDMRPASNATVCCFEVCEPQGRPVRAGPGPRRLQARMVREHSAAEEAVVTTRRRDRGRESTPCAAENVPRCFWHTFSPFQILKHFFYMSPASLLSDEACHDVKFQTTKTGGFSATPGISMAVGVGEGMKTAAVGCGRGTRSLILTPTAAERRHHPQGLGLKLRLPHDIVGAAAKAGKGSSRA